MDNARFSSRGPSLPLPLCSARRSFLAVLGLFFPVSALAVDGSPLDFLLDSTRLLFDRNTNFVFVPPPEVVERLTQDFGRLVIQRDLSAQTPLGTGNVELGASIESVRLEHSELWLATTGEAYRKAALPRLQLKIGLPYEANAGLSYYRNPSSRVSLQGVTVAKQLFEAKGYRPALGVSLGVTWIKGVSGLTFKTRSLQFIASKPMRWATPYVGTSFNRFRGRYADSDGLVLQMKAGASRRFIGLESPVGSFVLAAEIGDSGHASDAGFKVTWRF